MTCGKVSRGLEVGLEVVAVIDRVELCGGRSSLANGDIARRIRPPGASGRHRHGNQRSREYRSRGLPSAVTSRTFAVPHVSSRTVTFAFANDRPENRTVAQLGRSG